MLVVAGVREHLEVAQAQILVLAGRVVVAQGTELLELQTQAVVVEEIRGLLHKQSLLAQAAQVSSLSNTSFPAHPT